MNIKVVFIFLYLLSGCVHASITNKQIGCELNSKIQIERSMELLKIAKEDQDDRTGSYDSIDWNMVNSRDLKRRMRVATIFAEGCFKVASDYASAAIVYQHGKTADHYFQAFIWANESVKLGDASQVWLTAAALDRYLVSIGHKQLFGTQMIKGTTQDWCIQPVEPSFPEELRLIYVKFSIENQIANTLKGIGSTQSPSDVKVCEPTLKATPKGTVLGFW